MDPSSNIGNALRKLRFDRDLTLEEASKLTGVSKAMLGQIERGESNPTVSTLWKISSGLKISFSELLSSQTSDLDPIDIQKLDPVYESDGKMELYTVFPFDPISGFEYFYIKLKPGAKHVSSPHKNAKEEFIVLTQGELELEIKGEEILLQAPAAIKFNAGEEHVYSNPSQEEESIFQNIIK